MDLTQARLLSLAVPCELPLILSKQRLSSRSTRQESLCLNSLTRFVSSTKERWPTLVLQPRRSSISWTWGTCHFIRERLPLTIYRYQPANRQTTPDFLVTVTDPKGRIPIAGVVSQPRTADEFAAYFKSSKAGQRNRQDMEDYEREHVGKDEKKMEYVDSARAELAKHTSKSRFAPWQTARIFILTCF